MAIGSDAAMAVAFFASVASVAWSGAHAWSRWLARSQHSAQAAAPEHEYRLEQRLASIDHAVQAIAIEVERLGEGQRFTTRLLAERMPQDAAPPRRAPEYRRVDTPH
jgi:hypothetical protein